MGDSSFDANISPYAIKLDGDSFRTFSLSNLEIKRFVYDDNLFNAYEAPAQQIQSTSVLTAAEVQNIQLIENQRHSSTLHIKDIGHNATVKEASTSSLSK
jgi:hypothetical protein